jgi:hypothetical protein
MTDTERMLTIMRVMGRMRRKLEIMKLDRKAQQDSVYHDMGELLALLDMLERAVSHDDQG